MRLRLEGIPAFVVSRGDDTAGSVLVKLNTLDGTARLFQRSYDLLADRRDWTILAEGEDRQIEDTIKHQCQHDPDLWVIEVEDKGGRHLLDTPGLD